MTIHPSASFRPIPWKNGQGTTLELIKKMTQQGDAVLYRLSIATVANDGKFSDFNGMNRTLVLLEGSGMTLKHSSGQIDTLNRIYDYTTFDGGWQTDATLTDGTIVDFNVMANSAHCEFTVEVVRQAQLIRLDHAVSFIYAPATALQINQDAGTHTTLAAKSLLELTGAASVHIAGGPAICIGFSPEQSSC